MSDSVSQLTIRLLSTGDLTALTRGKEQSDALKVSVEALRATLGLLGTGFTVGAFVQGTKAAIEYGSAIHDLSLQAGISTQAFQSLAYVAEAAGVKQEELGGALNVLARNLAQAATGADKQNRAISDLGLNTAELLAMPVEQQIEEIAKAYTNAADKGTAWAAVIALLGKNSAKVKEILQELGAKGFAGIKEENPFIISDGDIARLDRYGDFWSKLWRQAKTVTAEIVARPGDALALLSNPAMGYGVFHAVGMRPDKAGEPGQGGAELEASEAMVAARTKEFQALREVQKAYEGPIEAAKRLRTEAEMFMRRWDILSTQKGNPVALLEAVKLRTEAAKLAMQANQEDAKAAKEKAQYDAANAEIYAKLTQLETKRGPLNEQIVQAKSREAELAKQLDGLSESSVTFREDEKRILTEILGVKTQIVALEEKEALLRVEQMAKDQNLKQKSQAVALLSIEYDFNLTDAQKWEEKRRIIGDALADQERYIERQRAMANDASLPQSARDKAAFATESGQNDLAGLQGEAKSMGPDPQSFIANFSANLTRLKSQWGTFQQQMASGLTGQIGSAVASVSRGIQGWISGGMTFKQGLTSIWQGFAQSAAQAFADMLAKYAVNKLAMFAIDQAIAAKGFLLSAAMAAKSLILWLPSAIAASISSFGLAAAIGAAAVIGIVASGGFEEGGYTGGREGRPAGIVHGQEFVWSAPAVRAIGVGNLERAHQAAISGGSGGQSGGGGSGGNITVITALSPEDVARSQRRYMDARVARGMGRIPTARFAG